MQDSPDDPHGTGRPAEDRAAARYWRVRTALDSLAFVLWSVLEITRHLTQ